MTILAQDLNANEIQCVGLGASQAVSFDASVQSTAFSANTRIIRIVATTDCFIAVGANPTATTSSTFIPFGSVEYFKVAGAVKVAALKSTTAGILYVTEGS